MATHAPAFLALVNKARRHISELPASQLPALMAQTPGLQLIDTRERSEFDASHVQGAVWLGKGIIERDIEALYPDPNTPLYLYCGGGFRSALAADALRRMGYTQVVSVDGGWRQLQNLLPTT